MSVVRMDGGGDRSYTGYWAAQSAGCWAGTTLPSPCHHLAIDHLTITCVQEAELGREEQTQAPNTLQSPARASVLVSLSVKL